MYGPGMWCVGSAPKRASCFRPDCVMPDRQRAQNRTFGFAPKPVVRWDQTASPKQTWRVLIPVFSLHVWTEPFGPRPDRPASDHWIARNPPENI